MTDISDDEVPALLAPVIADMLLDLGWISRNQVEANVGKLSG